MGFDDYDVDSVLSELVRRETMWLRHYIAQVVSNTDPLLRGRVLVTVPELGYDRPDQGLWCWPRHGHGISVPKMLEWVEVYFVAGDPNRPAYLTMASEVIDSKLTKFGGTPAEHVLFESPATGESVKYLDTGGLLTFLDGAEPFVKGNALLTYLNALVTEALAHTHGGAVGPPVGEFTAPAGTEVSIKIFGL